jgi:hypothetical protein
MKKQYMLFSGLAVILAILFSCQKKSNNNNISPGYGATGNPYPNNQTVTGSTSFTNPATQNTGLDVGNSSGWSNPTCFTTQSLTLRGYKENTDVVLSFAQAATTGTYNISSIPTGTTSCAITVNNAPGQPSGVVWYGKTGTVIVNVSGTSITANLKDIGCTQQSFGFPTVLVTGFLACSSQ